MYALFSSIVTMSSEETVSTNVPKIEALEHTYEHFGNLHQLMDHSKCGLAKSWEKLENTLLPHCRKSCFLLGKQY